MVSVAVVAPMLEAVRPTSVVNAVAVASLFAVVHVLSLYASYVYDVFALSPVRSVLLVLTALWQAVWGAAFAL